MLHHANFKDDNEQFVNIFVCQRWCHITAEGDPDLFFNNNNEEADVDAAAPAADTGAPLAEEEQDGAVIDIVNQVEARGYVLADDVDDNNEPAPENVPNNNNNNNIVQWQGWGHNGVCNW